jgi:hypothetical protein
MTYLALERVCKLVVCEEFRERAGSLLDIVAGCSG